MKRRTFIAGVGSFTAASTAAVGTGAFTSVSADRSLTVETAGDENAFLAMEPTSRPNSEYATLTTNDVLALDFTETDAGGEGLGTDSIYEFDVGDAETDIWLYADSDVSSLYDATK